MNLRLLLLSMLASSSALAQSNAPSTAAIPAPPPAPKYTGNCLPLYPQAAVEAGMEGDSVIAVHLTVDGTVRNPHLAQSSGHDILDRAAISCLSGAHLLPKTSQGVPLEVDETLQVQWRISSFIGSADHTVCSGGPYYPPVAVRLNHQGVTLLSFTVAGDGRVRNVAVAQSSGFPELDDAAMKCVSNFHYGPVTQDGKPVEYDLKTEINWRLQPLR